MDLGLLDAILMLSNVQNIVLRKVVEGLSKKYLTKHEKKESYQIFQDMLFRMCPKITSPFNLLKGEYASFMECYLKPDLLLIYKIERNTLKLVDISSHSLLFD